MMKILSKLNHLFPGVMINEDSNYYKVYHVLSREISEEDMTIVYLIAGEIL